MFELAYQTGFINAKMLFLASEITKLSSIKDVKS